jgi:molybdopterin-guanine dinucleotide biosynthesis protein A
MARAPVVGLFVGGKSSRMGGLPKGNLRHETGVRLVERLVTVVTEVLPSPHVVLVGQNAAYADLGLPSLSDAPGGIGPLGGLRALLEHAEEHGFQSALVLACDLPYVTPELVRRLSTEEPEALALAPRESGLWHALSARYALSTRVVVDAAVAAREHSLQRVFALLGDGARELAVADAELRALTDWDSPEDMASCPSEERSR